MTEAEIVNFFMANRDRLWAMANLFLRDHHLTEDALQETLLTLLQKRESYDPSRPLLHWAFGITRNKALKIVDKTGRYSLFGEEQLQSLQNDHHLYQFPHPLTTLLYVNELPILVLHKLPLVYRINQCELKQMAYLFHLRQMEP